MNNKLKSPYNQRRPRALISGNMCVSDVQILFITRQLQDKGGVKNFHINIFSYKRNAMWVARRESFESAMWLSAIPFIAMIAQGCVCHTLTDIHLTLLPFNIFHSSLSHSRVYMLSIAIFIVCILKNECTSRQNFHFRLFNKQRIQLKVKEWLHRVQQKIKKREKILNRLKWFIFISE
jgi:hypothetical protein